MIMKLTNKAKVWLGTISTLPIIAAIMIGFAAPAVAPTKAEALAVSFKAYENVAVFNSKQLVGLLQTVGFKGQALKYAWAFAMKESTGHALDYDGNVNTGDNSYGLFQINMIGDLGLTRRVYYGINYNAQLLNPIVNAQIAYKMSDHGKDWSAWKGTRQKIVQDWLAKYPYKEHTKIKAIAKAKVKVKVVGHQTKAVRKTKPKHKQNK